MKVIGWVGGAHEMSIHGNGRNECGWSVVRVYVIGW